MHADRHLLSSLLGLCLLSSGAPVAAQVLPGQWVGDHYLIHLLDGWPYDKVFIDEGDEIRETIPHISKSRDFPVPVGCLAGAIWSYWRGGALHTLADGCRERDADGAEFSRWTFAKWENGKWNFLGEYRTYAGGLLGAVPCDGGRFIVTSSNADLVDNGRPNRTPFCLMSIPPGKTEAVVVASIDHGQDGLRGYMSDPACFGLACRSHVAMTDDHATLVNHRTGLYWVFSLERASLVKAGCIFKKVAPEMAARGGFPNAVIGIGPEKGGTVLVAAEEEDIFMAETVETTKAINDAIENNPSMTEDEIEKMIVAHNRDMAEKSPFIVWYRIYPENGRVEKLAGPPPGGASIREGGKNDYWRPMPDGSVRMGYFEAALAERSGRGKADRPSAAGGAGAEASGAEPIPEGAGATGEMGKGNGADEDSAPTG